MHHEPLDDAALARLFTEARTYNSWSDRAVDEATVRKLYALVSQGPTTANSHPGRFVFIRSTEAHERLRPHLRRRPRSPRAANPVWPGSKITTSAG